MMMWVSLASVFAASAVLSVVIAGVCLSMLRSYGAAAFVGISAFVSGMASGLLAWAVIYGRQL